MKIILDTNVLMSGVFFSGPPHRILSEWRLGRIETVLSHDIVEEYEKVGQRLSLQYPGIDIQPILSMLLANSLTVKPKKLPRQICDDPHDDKFIACALAANCKFIVSGDKAMLRASGYEGIEILRPALFVSKYLNEGDK